MPQPPRISPEQIFHTVGRAIGKQRRDIDAQLFALRDASTILTTRLLRSADAGLTAFMDKSTEEGMLAPEFCQTRFGDPLNEALGEFHFSRSLSADVAILRSDGTPLMRGGGSKVEHLRMLLLRNVEAICGRPVPRGFQDDVETANAVFLRSKSERLSALAAGLAGDPLGDVRALNVYHMLADARSLGAAHPELKPVEVKLSRAREALSDAADVWSSTVDKWGHQPHRMALLAHKRRDDRILPPAYNGNPIAKAVQSCALRFQSGQPFQLKHLREAGDA